jgi:hypothetical protein
MANAPIIRITYRPAPNFEVGGRSIQGIHIANKDVLLLRVLAEHNNTIRLVCDGHPTYHVRVQTLLQRIVKVQSVEDWYISVSSTGPLRPIRSPDQTKPLKRLDHPK